MREQEQEAEQLKREANAYEASQSRLEEMIRELEVSAKTTEQETAGRVAAYEGSTTELRASNAALEKEKVALEARSSVVDPS